MAGFLNYQKPQRTQGFHQTEPLKSPRAPKKEGKALRLFGGALLRIGPGGTHGMPCSPINNNAPLGSSKQEEPLGF